MDSVLSVQNEVFTWDGKKFVKIHGTVAQTESCVCRQLDGIWESMWRFIMESPHFNTHRSETNGIAERAVRRVKEGTSAVLLQSGLDEKWWSDCYGMLLLSAKCPRPPGRWENSVWKTIWRTIQRANNTFWGTGRISSDLHQKTKQEFINLARKYYQESFLAMSWSREEFGKEIFWWQIWKIWKSWMHQILILEESTRREVLIRQKDDEFIFPFADGTAKLSGRDHEFREPTLRREPTVRSEDFSRELHGEPGESQPTESTDDVEARADFWSIQGDIHRHHDGPRVHSSLKHSLIPLKYIDVTRSAHTDLDVLQEKRIDHYWNVDSSRHLSDSWKGFTKFTLLKEKPPKGYMCSEEETDKDSNDYQTRSCMARSLDENW